MWWVSPRKHTVCEAELFALLHIMNTGNLKWGNCTIVSVLISQTGGRCATVDRNSATCRDCRCTVPIWNIDFLPRWSVWCVNSYESSDEVSPRRPGAGCQEVLLQHLLQHLDNNTGQQREVKPHKVDTLCFCCTVGLNSAQALLLWKLFHDSILQFFFYV